MQSSAGSDFRRIRDLWDPDFLFAQLRRLQSGPGSPLSPEQFTAVTRELSTRRPAGAIPTLVPRHPALNILQSTLETCLRLQGKEVLETPATADPHLPDAQLRPGIDIYRRFGPCDPRWVEVTVAEGLRLLEGRPSFPAAPAPDAWLADDARVVLVGDWGTGLPAAEAVGRAMGRELAAAEGRDRHLIHLGDVYYSGWREEYLTHFLPYWPHRPGDTAVRSWALNGNHDMASGGHGYFGFLLRDPRFRAQAGSSHFRIAGRHWQILGLDSAYQDQDLAGDQAEWAQSQILGSGLRTILLTHHQLFSVYESVPGHLRDRLLPALQERPLEAWFWGHEHRCLVYAPTRLVRWPRCIGHGGIPMLVPPPQAPLPAGVLYEFREATVIGPDRWGLFGFAVLDFDGPSLLVRYLNERGQEHYRELFDG